MDDGRWTNSVSLRFFSEALSTDALAAALDIRPDESYRMGDPLTLRRGTVTHRKNNALYLHSGIAEDRPLDEHLAAVLEKANKSSEAVRSLSDKVTWDVYCNLPSRGNWRGFVLSPATMAGFFGLGLHVCVFFELPQLSIEPSESRNT